MYILQRLNVVKRVDDDFSKDKLIKLGFKLLEEIKEEIEEEIKTNKKTR